MKTIGLHDDTYWHLFAVQNEMEREKHRRVPFSEIIDGMIREQHPGALKMKRINET